MSSILYYSNVCENSKRILQKISSSNAKDEMHFVCIDRRTRKPNGATYVILSNEQEILLPPTITKVPAMLLLNRGHHVLFGDEIDKHIESQYNEQYMQQQHGQQQQQGQRGQQQHGQQQQQGQQGQRGQQQRGQQQRGQQQRGQQQQQQQNLKGNMVEPEAFSIGGSSGFGVSSDFYSFLDQDAEQLSAKGDGGMRQLHHYASVNHEDIIQTPPDEYQADTIGNVSLEQLQQQRNMDIGPRR